MPSKTIITLSLDTKNYEEVVAAIINTAPVPDELECNINYEFKYACMRLFDDIRLREFADENNCKLVLYGHEVTTHYFFADP